MNIGKISAFQIINYKESKYNTKTVKKGTIVFKH